MALADIIAAIIAQADQQIMQSRSAHQTRLRDLRDENDKLLAEKKQSVAASKEQKKEQMKVKSLTHAEMIKRNATLRKKQDILDSLYSDVVDALCALPKDNLEAFLSSCLKNIKAKGTIHPAKTQKELLSKLASGTLTVGEPIDAKGGFLFVSEKEEQDFTFEHIVSSQLRPATEVEAAQELF